LVTRPRINPAGVGLSRNGLMRDTFDEIDRKLIALLQQNDRLSLADLSNATGSASSTINDRIKRLVRNGVITGFHARLSSEALGLELLAFVLVGWSDPKVEANFIGAIQQSADVLECHHITGAWNYLLKVRVRTTRELESFLANTVKGIEGVQRTDTMIVLSSAKETWTMRVPD
jgi:Lrp/AsnC family transcriptional regulator, leucine-responsive regulatory protein